MHTLGAHNVAKFENIAIDLLELLCLLLSSCGLISTPEPTATRLQLPLFTDEHSGSTNPNNNPNSHRNSILCGCYCLDGGCAGTNPDLSLFWKRLRSRYSHNMDAIRRILKSNSSFFMIMDSAWYPLEDWLMGNFVVPEGRKPLIITIDDLWRADQIIH